MARININVGTNANDGTGDDLRAAMQKINTNFTELYGTTAEANDLIEDASPQLGGNLDINGFNITSSRSNEDIKIVPNGTGNLILGVLRVNGTTISSDDSSKITLAESVDITGTLTAAVLQVNELSSSDSSTIQINDGVNISGILTANTLVTNDISSSDSSAIQINDGVNISGITNTATLFVNDDNITIARRWNDDSTRPSSVGKSGDTVGMIAWEDDAVYVCIANYDGSTLIWRRAALSTF